MTFKMNGIRVKVAPPDVCYLYPPYKENKSTSMFTVTARSKSVPVAYKLLCYKNPSMKIKIDERVNYNHIPADIGIIKPSDCKVFRVTLLPGYDPMEGKDDGFNVLVALTTVDRANLRPDDWWNDEYTVVERVDFLMMGQNGGRSLPEDLVRLYHPDQSVKHPGRVLSGFDQDDQLAKLLGQQKDTKSTQNQIIHSRQNEDDRKDRAKDKTRDSGIRQGSSSSTHSPHPDRERRDASGGEHSTHRSRRGQIDQESGGAWSNRCPPPDLGGFRRGRGGGNTRMERSQSRGGGDCTNQAMSLESKEQPTLPSLADGVSPEEEIKLIDDLIKSLNAERAKIDGMFQSALTALERAEKFRRDKF